MGSNEESSVKEIGESGKERELSFQAKSEYDAGNFEETLKLLDCLNDNKSVQLNRIITKFCMNADVDQALKDLSNFEDLELDQQALADYNKALLLAKCKKNYDEALKILEERMSVLTEPYGLVDEKITVLICQLLSIIYIERRKDPTKTLRLLSHLTEKFSSNLPPRLQQLKALCYLQIGSTKSAKRELKAISGEYLLRSYMELQRGNLKKAMKTFLTGSSTEPYHINNEALIYYHQGKKNTALHMLMKIKDPSPEIIYNLGVMNLFTGNYDNAFNLLYSLISHYPQNARLWLRLAECKLEKYKAKLNDDFDLAKRKQEIVWGYAGEGPYRKLIFRGCNNDVKDKEDLLFARQCLLNSIALLESDGDNVCFYPSRYLLEADLVKLKIWVYLSLSYVCLCICDYAQAHRFAMCSLQLSPEGYFKVLANLYGGEALVLMDFIREGITCLSCDEEIDWDAGKVVLCYNLSVAYTLRGEYAKASETLRYITSNLPNNHMIPIQVIRLAIYIQLAQQFPYNAKYIIQKHQLNNQ